MLRFSNPADDPSPTRPHAASATGERRQSRARTHEESFERLYDDHAAFVARAVRRLGVTDPQIEDVVQEVFLVAFRRLGEFEWRSPITTWLYGIALRVVRLQRRTSHRADLHGAIDRSAAEQTEKAAGAAAARPDIAAETADAYRVLLQLLRQLDEDKREIFVLVELEQLPVPEVAELLGLKLNTAYSRLRLAREAFEKALKGSGRST
jgi:RNA polymerase sigma-70 factor (ECF subfamily)